MGQSMNASGPSRDRAVIAERVRVLALLRRHGFNTTSFQVLEDGLAYWWESDDACVAYAETGSAWVAAGAPISAQERCGTVARQFVAEARARGRRAVFFASQERLARVPGLVSTQVGLQPVWDPNVWAETVRRSRSLRAQVGRARAKGVVVRRVSASELSEPGSPIRRDIERLIARWLETRRMSAMGFLVRVQLFSFATERRTFVAERAGAIVGLASAIPVYARNGWFLEDFVRDPDAPNGTIEMLVDAVMRQAATEGSPWVTLGLVPLSGSVPRWMRGIGVLGRPLYDFAGLQAFKSKLAPSGWEPVYVTHPPDVPTCVAVIDALRAFAGGRLSLFVAKTLIEGPALVLWTLGLGLIPWTLALVLAGPRWFPSRAIHTSWIALDVVIAIAMVCLARRFERRLALATAAVVTADAIASIVQAIAWNATRMRGVLELSIVIAACAAPAFATLVLWRSVQRAGRSSTPRSPRALKRGRVPR
jgi:phosphatidylglycerol lysyltransferase